METKGKLSKTKKIVIALAAVIAVIVIAVILITTFSPIIILKDSRVSIEVGDDFRPLSQISKVKNADINSIEVSTDVDTEVPGTYTVTYKYLYRKVSLTVVVEDRDYPVFSIKDGTDYYMSTDFDINNIVVSVTDKTGVRDFSYEFISGGLDTPGTAELQLTASDNYGHVTKNTVTVNVIDDIYPVLTLKDEGKSIEAGESAFDPSVFVESATDNCGTPVITYEITSGSLSKVGTVKAMITAEDASGNKVSSEVSFKTVDTTAPVVSEKSGSHVYKMSEKLDPSRYFDISDNTVKTKVSYDIVSGNTDAVGTITLDVKVSDDYGNETDAGTITVEVQDDIPPEFTLTRTIYTINLGRYFDVDSIIATSYDNSGEVTFSYAVKEGTLEHAGYCVVNIIATDKYGNTTTIPAPFNIVDKVAPVLALNTEKQYFILGSEFSMEDLISTCTDNDEVASTTMNILSGSFDTLGDVVVAITATDPSGNSTTRQMTIRVKQRVYQDFGTEKNVEITGREGQPYLVAVNRYMGVVTVYGKDDNGDYTVPVKAMLCSVGKNSAIESNFGVRSGDGLTPLGVYNTIGKTNTGWGTLFSNDSIHTYVYGQYTVRIVGYILFHSVPYFWQRKDALEWTGTIDNLNHEFNKLGSPASLGCIRLCVADVKWIYDNCPTGFTVVIYDEKDNYGPLGRPENFIIDPKSEMLADIDPAILGLSGSDKSSYNNADTSKNPLNWDPTDPDPNNPWIAILEAWNEKQKEKAEATEGAENGAEEGAENGNE